MGSGGFLLEVSKFVYLSGQSKIQGNPVDLAVKGIIGVCAVLSILFWTQAGLVPLMVLTGVYAFLTIRFEDTSILDFIRYACEFFFIRQQFYEWRYTR